MPKLNINYLLLVAVGGAIGSILRYLFMEMMVFINRGSNFPFVILSINILGSFLIGVLHFFLVNYFGSISPQTRLFLSVGLLGGFTTFSAFSLDAFRLIESGQFLIAFTYVFSSIIFSIIAIFFGFYLAKIIF